VPYRKEGGRRLVLVDDVRARATAEAPPDTAASAAPDGEAEADRTEPAPVVEPVVEPEAAEEPDPVAEPEAVAEPQPEETPSEATEADSFTLSWPPAGPPAAAPPRRSYDLIPDDGGRRGRRH